MDNRTEIQTRSSEHVTFRFRDLFTWSFLKDPVAICTAIVSALLIAILANSYSEAGFFNLVWIVTSVILIMIFGSAQRVLVEAVFRMIGTVLGVGLGALLAFGHNQMLKHGASAVGLYAYQISLEVVVVFLVAILVKLYPALYGIFAITGLTTALLLFSPDLTVAHQRTLSVLIAVAMAFVSTLLFHYTLAEEVLFSEHRKIALDVLELTELAVSSEYTAKREFDLASHEVRDAIQSASSAWGAYAQWRRITFRKPVYDFGSLTDALRPLYYEVFSLYWSHTETTQRPREAQRLYCDSESDFNELFRPLIHALVASVRKCREALERVLRPTGVSPQTRLITLERLLPDLSSSLFLNMELLNLRYIENRLLCFSTRHQRWSVCDYMISLTCLLMELVEYLKFVVHLFATEDVRRYRDFEERLDHLKARLNTLKYESRLSVDVVGTLAVVPTRDVLTANPDHAISERVLPLL